MEPTATQTTASYDEPTTFPVGGEYIGVHPGFCGGKPHILGHRIKVKHVAIWHERQGMTPVEILAVHPTITPAQVHAALAYFYDHRSEIEAEMAEEDRMFEELRTKQPSILEKAEARKAHAADDPLSSR
jgi:uncharacterized protein (DUF433 family)